MQSDRSNYPRFAPHLEKCMGMGRNSSRLASRRLATIGSKAGMHNDGDPDDNEAPGDEDWCEPGPAAGAFMHMFICF